MNSNKLLIVIILGGLLVAGCGVQKGGDKTVDSGRLKIVCTTGMTADLARNVAGDKAEVTGLMGPGVDPHLYKASQGDVQKLAGADIVFYNGLHLEGKMTEILEKMSRKKRVVPVSRDIPREKLVKLRQTEDAYDPHIWFDVSLWAETLDLVAGELKHLDGENGAYYSGKASEYRRELKELHLWVRDQISSIPVQHRALVTAHDAFSYFGRAYGIEVVGLQGISTVAEYGVNDVTRLVDLIVARRIRAIFLESSVPQRSLNAVNEGARARGFEVEIGGTLFSDAMGAPDSGADNYLGMVRANVNTIVSALK